MRVSSRPLFAALIVGVTWFAAGNLQPSTSLHSPRVGSSRSLGLQPPAFVQIANAASAPDAFDIGAKLDDEAGISAWYKSPDAITISQVRTAFRTVEVETTDYIIGSVAVPNYKESAEVHAYVHKSGWILAYYSRSVPVSKIIDVAATTITTTKLKTVVAAIASAGGAPFIDVTYYDFRYPNATNMLLIAEDCVNGNSFTVQLPSSYGYFERGWAVTDLYGCQYGGEFIVDGVNLYSSSVGNDRTDLAAGYGLVAASQLLPDTAHTITMNDWAVLVIIYRVP